MDFWKRGRAEVNSDTSHFPNVLREFQWSPANRFLSGRKDNLVAQIPGWVPGLPEFSPKKAEPLPEHSTQAGVGPPGVTTNTTASQAQA